MKNHKNTVLHFSAAVQEHNANFGEPAHNHDFSVILYTIYKSRKWLSTFRSSFMWDKN
jgi:hypothetical protein